MAIENVGLLYEFGSKQLHMDTTRMKLDKEREEESMHRR